MTSVPVELNKQGRLTVPADIRRELGFSADSQLVATVENGAFVVRDRRQLLADFQDRYTARWRGAGLPESSVDLLLAERRQEAETEARAQ